MNGERGWRKVFLGKASVEAILAYLPERPTNGGDALWLNVKGRPLLPRMASGNWSTAGHRGQRHRSPQSPCLPPSGRQILAAHGINAQIVAKALGHADVTVTLLIYGNQDDRHVSQAVREAEMAPFEDPAGLDDLELSTSANFWRRETPRDR